MRHPMSHSRYVVLVVALSLFACQPAPDDQVPAPAEPESGDAAEAIVDVRVEDFAFHAPPQLNSGWTTFRMSNEGEQPHFMMLWKLPENVDFAQYSEMSRMFQEEYDRYTGGEFNEEELVGSIGASLPAWFGELGAMGGVALTSPGHSAETTVHLEPGDYVMECYVVTPEGIFHGTEGMLRPLIVTEEGTGAEPPAADVEITLTNFEMVVEGELTAGEHVFAVHAVDAAPGIVAHDVNLARLSEDTSLDEVASWMNFITALRNPAPAEFLGGADHLGGGSTAYFRAVLEPGRYAFVSEGFSTQGMLHEFVIE
jgi:hypothetical protein